MNYFLTHLAETMIVLGLLLLIIEIVVIGFATFVLFFLGLAMMISGGLMLANILPESGISALWSVGLLTGASAALLWIPLKRLQSQEDNHRVTQDFANQRFVLRSDVDAQGLATHSYSGIQWKLKSEQPIAAGTEVRVTRIEVGVLWVEPFNGQPTMPTS